MNATRLREARKTKGLTQQQLADLTSLDQSTVSKIENGDVGASWSVIARLATALDLSLDDLVTDNDRAASQSPATGTEG